MNKNDTILIKSQYFKFQIKLKKDLFRKKTKSNILNNSTFLRQKGKQVHFTTAIRIS